MPPYLVAERHRLLNLLPELYDKNAEDEIGDTAGALLHGVECLERSPEPPDGLPTLQALDDMATTLMCTGDVTVEIGEGWRTTEGSYPERCQLRIMPQIARLQGVTKLWRQPTLANGTRTGIGSSRKHGKTLEYIYGRLFEHRRAPKCRQGCGPPLPAHSASPRP